MRLLLNGLVLQSTDRFTFDVVVVDNDRSEGARQIVEDFARRRALEITYAVEPQQGIARARNLAVKCARGNLVAFLDDDEVPSADWLSLLVGCLRRNPEIHGVLGPVKPRFDHAPPEWVLAGGFYDRPSYPTGTIITWRQGRTGNVLFRREVFAGSEMPFDPEFTVAEDQDFFRRQIERGRTFMWCHEAIAHEYVPPIRWDRGFMIHRALQRGRAAWQHPENRARKLTVSLAALPAYALALPFLALLRRRSCMKYAIKLFDHLGRILAALHVNPASTRYLTQ